VVVEDAEAELFIDAENVRRPLNETWNGDREFEAELVELVELVAALDKEAVDD
jgi:hypothetical protein